MTQPDTSNRNVTRSLTSTLEVENVPVERIFLDPNNPRFWTENQREIPERDITNATVQDRTLSQICQYGVSELKDSILSNGFLPLDRIVVRPIQNSSNYVVVEGNRRLAAIKVLLSELPDLPADDYTQEYIEELTESLSALNVLIYKGTEQHNIAWILQGIRHISGIMDWPTAQRAKLVTDLLKRGEKPSTIGQQLGLSVIAVNRFIRGYAGLQQMREDEEYGSKATNNLFSLFEEAYSNVKTRQWLAWNDNTRKYDNTDNLKQFYSWIVGDAQNDNRRRIHDPRHIKILSSLIEHGREDLIGQVDRYEITIEQARDIASQSQGQYNWRSAIELALRAIRDLPNRAYDENPDELRDALQSLQERITATMARLDVNS